MILRAIFKHYLSSALKYIPFYNLTYPDIIYLFKVSNGNIGTTCWICSQLRIKTLNIFHNLLWFYTRFEQATTSWVLRASFTDNFFFFSFNKVKCEFWGRHTSKMGDFVKIFISLNRLKFLQETIKSTEIW